MYEPYLAILHDALLIAMSKHIRELTWSILQIASFAYLIARITNRIRCPLVSPYTVAVRMLRGHRFEIDSSHRMTTFDSCRFPTNLDCATGL